MPPFAKMPRSIICFESWGGGGLGWAGLGWLMLKGLFSRVDLKTDMLKSASKAAILWNG